MFEKLPFEEVEHNPEVQLPEDHVSLLAVLLQYCAEVMIQICPVEHPEAGMEHSYISAFENAVGLLEGHGLVVPETSDENNSFYRLAVPYAQFTSILLERHQARELTFDDFNRALEAPLHLDRQTDARASKATIANVIKALRNLGLVKGPQGASVWTDKVLFYVWFSAHGSAIESVSYSGNNEFERFYIEAL